jgi:glutathione synthase/RimK-type ligase-like ATP-grasp enzyme
VVLKIPDGSFSRGVVKANNPAEFKEHTEKLFKESDLILAQEFLFTQFDWRIGILNHQPLFACQYFMSRKHWQIVKHSASGRAVEGGFKTWRLEDAPRAVVDTALSLARLIGDGLYGVDLKQNERGVYVIEINDNPNIDAGIEDEVLGDQLYEAVIKEFVRRLDA